MSLTNAISSSQSSMKMLRAMVGIGSLCGLLIVLTYEGTLPRIEKNRAEALEKAIFKVLPGISQTQKYYLDPNENFKPVDENYKEGTLVYAGFNNNDELKGIAIEARGQGYADIIKILYGYDPQEQKIIGFYVLESKETPGLGDKIEKDETFLDNFKALDVALNQGQNSLKNQIVPVKSGTKKNAWEIDGITGATISSRAIANILDVSTQYWVPRIFPKKANFKLMIKQETDIQE